MPLILPGNVASATASTTYDVANSCRFNGGDSVGMSRTMGTPTDADKWTFSCWVKRGAISNGTTMIFYAFASPDEGGPKFYTTNDSLRNQNWVSSAAEGDQITTRQFRDAAAWYHIVCVYDAGNATAGNRMRIYVNGTEETVFTTDANPDQNQASAINSAIKHCIGSYNDASNFFDGYIAECVFSDGQAYAASDFGEFDSDSPTIWKPKDPSGLTFGDNGFWLDFEDSADLGKDVSGEGNDFTVANLDATDQATDTPTNNFCVMNPLDSYWGGATFSQGNCKVVFSAPLYGFKVGTFGLTSGKWYFEAKILTNPGSYGMGIADHVQLVAVTTLGYGTYQWQYQQTGIYDNGDSRNTPYGDSYTNGDIVACALDLDNNKIYWSKAGVWQASSDPTDGTNAVAITDPASGPKDGCYYPSVADWDDIAGGDIWEVNFGGCSAFTVSSGNADDNGYGNFEYDVPAGYYAICSKNVGEFGG